MYPDPIMLALLLAYQVLSLCLKSAAVAAGAVAGAGLVLKRLMK